MAKEILWACLWFVAGGLSVVIDLHDRPIKSQTPIQPRLEITVENNQVDTMYVYEIPE